MPRENKPLEAATGEQRTVSQQLAEFDKVRIMLFQNRAPQPILPDKLVSLNGLIFQIMRGKNVEVPRPVYELLVQSGEIGPQTEEDDKFVPSISAVPIG